MYKFWWLPNNPANDSNWPSLSSVKVSYIKTLMRHNGKYPLLCPKISTLSIHPWSSWIVELWKKTLYSHRSVLYLNLVNIVVKQKQVENFICDLGIWRLEEDSIFNIEVVKSLEKLLLSNHLYLHRISITQHRTPSE